MIPQRSNRLQRRSFLGIGLAGGLTAIANATFGATRAARAKNVLVIYEQGGLSHIDTFDPKPEAPIDQRSPFTPISTSVPGIQLTSLCKRTATIADKLAIVRSMYHKGGAINGHPDGTQYALSGAAPGGPVEMPDMGGVVSHRLGTRCRCRCPRPRRRPCSGIRPRRCRRCRT